LKEPEGDTYKFSVLGVKAIALKRRHPDWSGNRVARELNVSPQSLSRALARIGSETSDAILWAYETLSAAHYFEDKARQKLSYGAMSRAAHMAKWERLREGYWLFDRRKLRPGYKLGEDRRIELDPANGERLTAALKAVLQTPVSIAAKNNGFKREFLRDVVKQPEFYLGQVRVPNPSGGFHWVLGKHPRIISNELREELLNREKLYFRIPPDKIREIFRLKSQRNAESSLHKIAAVVDVPWQTVADVLRNPKAKAIVGTKLWAAAVRTSRSHVTDN